jgi:hypothetical protein
MCRDCFVTGQMPVCNAGGNKKVTRATMPVQQGQRRSHEDSNDASTMPATTTVQCWQWRRHNVGKDASTMPAKTPTLHRLDHPRPSHRGMTPSTAMRPQARTMTTTATPRTQTCCDCVVVGQMPVCNAGGNASAMRAKRPARHGQQHQRNAGNNNSAMLARTPA